MNSGRSNLIKNFVLKYPVVIYYFTTFLISWGGLALMVGPDGISSQPGKAPFLPLYLVTVAGPFIAGILLTGLYDGKKGYGEFLSRLLKWRVQLKWYAAAILIAPVTVFAVLFALSIFSPVFMPGIFNSGDNPVSSMFGLSNSSKVTLFMSVLMIGLFNGFVEEIGWTGFATPRLRLRHTVVASGINLGIMWGLWHLFSNYLGSAAGAGTMPLALYIAVLLFSFLPPFRILMTWVYDHTKSLFIAIVMHASLDVFWILSMPNVLTGQQRATWYLVWASLLWIIVTVVGLVDNKKRTS